MFNWLVSVSGQSGILRVFMMALCSAVLDVQPHPKVWSPYLWIVEYHICIFWFG